jgi:hypothetical protein
MVLRNAQCHSALSEILVDDVAEVVCKQNAILDRAFQPGEDRS